MKPFFVYVLRCADGTFYVGHTDELERRVAEHHSGAVLGYTHGRRPVELVWSQETASRLDALTAEQRIKGWSRAKKQALIAGDWGWVSMLARSAGPRPAQRERDATAEVPRARLRQAQPERGANTEVPRTRLRQAQPERDFSRAVQDASGPVQDASGPIQDASGRAACGPVRAEPVEASASSTTDVPHAGLGQTQPERDSSSDVAHAGRQQARPERDARLPGDASLVHALTQGDRRALAKSITLLESTRPDHRLRADQLLNTVLPRTGQAMRLGISGVPGVGKSTFIEALGLALIARGHRVAVLAIDPSSSLSGGSILGDKTRMERLSTQDAAYIRPSPASGTLGGVAEKTRETMLVCEAAGYDVVIVETVGVGQSETAVASMTDMFVLLQLPNAGDDLQAIKKGVMELADLVVINKADLDPDAATRAQAHISGSLRMFSMHAPSTQWVPRVMQLSALRGQGVDTFWSAVLEFHDKRHASGEFEARRRQQSLAWMWDIVHARLLADFRHHPAVRAALAATVRDVTEARLAPSSAARSLLTLFEQEPR